MVRCRWVDGGHGVRAAGAGEFFTCKRAFASPQKKMPAGVGRRCIDTREGERLGAAQSRAVGGHSAWMAYLEPGLASSSGRVFGLCPALALTEFEVATSEGVA